MKILAVIPAYNEEDCILRTVQNLKAACPAVDYVIVNDGSRDNTQRICEQNGLNVIIMSAYRFLASMPNSSGANRRAITIWTTRLTTDEADCSKSFHTSEVMVLCRRFFSSAMRKPRYLP